MKVNRFTLTRWSTFRVGHVLANLQTGIGLQRIPKVASTHFRSALSLSDWISPAEAADSLKRVFSFTRSPAERLLSSIPETLLRARPPQGDFPGDVIVSDEVYGRIRSIDASTEATLVAEFLAIIEDEGVFEPHHFPASWFLFDRYSKPRLNPLVVQMRDMNLLLEELGVNSMSEKTRLNSRSKQNRTSRLDGIKAIAGKSRAALVPKYRRNYPENHPITTLVHGRQNLNSYHVGKSLTSWYERAKKSPDVQSLVNEFASAHFEDDIRLEENLRNQTTNSAAIYIPLVDLGMDCDNPPPQ